MNAIPLPRRPLALLLLLGLFFGGAGPVDLLTSAEASASKDKRRIKTLTRQNRGMKRTVATLRRQLVEARRPVPPIPQPVPFIEMVTVGNAGNAADQDFGDGALGAVPYEFRIGKYEVTLAQYAVFLNAVAATDTYGLYSGNMATHLHIAGIERSPKEPYSYTVIGSGDRPVTFVSWFDAARFCNWLHNGRPTGGQDASTTERGAYILDGADSGLGIERVWAAKFWIPSEDEWYKAAYHQPQGQGGPEDHFWDYPTRRDVPNTPGNVVGPSENHANFFTTVFSVTQNGSFDPNQNYLTEAGSYPGSASFYGTFDQGGNVWEWNDAVISTYRGARGGAWFDGGESELRSSRRGGFRPDVEGNILGFRVASP